MYCVRYDEDRRTCPCRPDCRTSACHQCEVHSGTHTVHVVVHNAILLFDNNVNNSGAVGDGSRLVAFRVAVFQRAICDDLSA